MKKGQKRRVLAFLLAFSMLVGSFTGVPVQAEEAQVASGLFFSWPKWSDNRPSYDESAELLSAGDACLGGTDIFLGYKNAEQSVIPIDEYADFDMDKFTVTVNGNEAPKGSYSIEKSMYRDAENEIEIENQDIYNFSFYEMGDYVISYPMGENENASLAFHVDYPEMAAYASIDSSEENDFRGNGFIQEFQYSKCAEENAFYYVGYIKPEDNKTITLADNPLVINGNEEINVSQYASIESDEKYDNVYKVTINANNIPDEGINLTLNYVVNNGEDGENYKTSIYICEKTSGLVMGALKEEGPKLVLNENEGYYKNTESYIGSSCYYFGFDSSDGSEVISLAEHVGEAFSLDQFVITKGGEIVSEDCYEILQDTYWLNDEEFVNEDIYRIVFYETGTYQVSYPMADRDDNYVTITVTMPRIGVYDAEDINEANLIDYYAFDRYATDEQAFYVILQKRDGEEIAIDNLVEFDGDYGEAKVADYLTVTKVENTEDIYKITVNVHAFPDDDVAFKFCANFNGNSECHWMRIGQKKTGLLATDWFTGEGEQAKPHDEASFGNVLYRGFDPYGGWDMSFIYLAEENGEAVNISVKDLVFTDENGKPIDVVKETIHTVHNAEIAHVKFDEIGTYYASYTKDDKVFKVKLVYDLPEMGFYTESERTVEALLKTDQYTMQDDGEQDVLYFIADKSYWSYEIPAWNVIGYKATADVVKCEEYDLRDDNLLCYEVTLKDENAGYLLEFSYDKVHVEGENEERLSEAYGMYMTTGKQREIYGDGESHTGFAGCYMQDYEYEGNGLNWDSGLPMYWVHADSIQGVIDKLEAVERNQPVLINEKNVGIINTGYFAINVSHTGNMTLTEQFVTPKNATAIQIVAGQDVQMTTHPAEEDGTYIEDSVFYVDEETRALLPTEYKNIQYISDYNGGLYVAKRYTPQNANEYNYILGEEIEALRDISEEAYYTIVAEDKKLWNPFELPELYLTMNCNYKVDGPCSAIHMQYLGDVEVEPEEEPTLTMYNGLAENLQPKEFKKGESESFDGILTNDLAPEGYYCKIDTFTVQATTGTYEEDVVVKTPDDKKDLVDVENGLTPEQKAALKEEDSNVELDVKTDAIDASDNNLENTIKEAISAIKYLIANSLNIPQENAPVFVDISVNVTVKNGDKVVGEANTNITETKKPIDVTMDIPENIRGNNRRYKVVRYHDGKAEELETEVMNNGKSIRFATNKFSTYAIVYEEIVKQDFDMSQVRWDYTEEFTYDGEEKSVQLIGLPDGLIPIYENDVAYEVGNYNATVTFQYDMTLYNAPSAVESLNWSIVAASPKKQDFDMSNVKWNYSTAFTYDGTAKTVTLTGLPAGLTANYTGNTATEVGNYVASVSFTYDTEVYNMPTQVANLNWSIVAPPAPPAPAKSDFDMSNVKWDYATAFTYDGTAKTVALTGLPSGLTATYSGNTATDAGVYTATVVFNYDAEKYNAPKAIDALTWTINKADAAVKVSKVSISKTYGDKAFSLGVTAAKGTKVAYKSSDTKVVKVSTTGKVTIKGCGQATITITASGANFETSQKKVTVTVKPKKVSIKKLTSPKKKSIKITWAKDSKVTGYEIEYSTNKKFTKKTTKKVTISKYKTISKTIGKLKSKKKYYVRIRAYKKSGKTKIYGAWSTVKSIKVK